MQDTNVSQLSTIWMVLSCDFFFFGPFDPYQLIGVIKYGASK